MPCTRTDCLQRCPLLQAYQHSCHMQYLLDPFDNVLREDKEEVSDYCLVHLEGKSLVSREQIPSRVCLRRMSGQHSLPSVYSTLTPPRPASPPEEENSHKESFSG